MTNMEIDISMNILNNVNDLHLFWNILDFVKESPIQCYKMVIEELKHNLKKKCGNNCMFRTHIFDGRFITIPMLVRSTHAECINCGCSVSDYSHRFCYCCAEKGTTEYNYHHRRCRGFTEENNLITDPIQENDNFMNLL